MKTYKTASGSVYDVDGNMIRRRVRSKISRSERVAEEWREAKEIRYSGLNQPLTIVWGTGRDEHSENAIQVGDGPDDACVRHTWTTPVVSVVEDSDGEQN